MIHTERRCTRHLAGAVRAALAAGLMLASATAPHAAERTDGTLGTIVVTGTRLDDEIERVPNATVVVDRAEIETRNPVGVLELLRHVPGIHVSEPGGAAGVSSLFLRGGEPNFTVVLVDGVKVNDPTNTRGGSFDFSTLEVGDVERVEIVRGPQSAVYGSDALSGVVNIITRTGTREFATTVGAEGGAEGLYRAALGATGPVGDAGRFAVRASAYDEGDYYDGSTFERRAVVGKLALGAPDSWRLGLHARVASVEGSAFPEDSGGPRLAVLTDRDRKSADDVGVGADLALPLGRTTLHATVNWYRHEDEFASPGVVPGVRDGVPPRTSATDLDRTYAGLHAETALGQAARFTVGADWNREDGTTGGAIEFFPGFVLPNDFALRREVVGAFAEAQVRPARALTLLASLRRDEPRDGEAETTAKAGAVLQLGSGTRLHANWGQGFKLPSFFALGSPLVGNPDLLPEKSRSVDVGVEQRLGARSRIALTLFDNEFRDLIDFDFETFRQVNRARVGTRGAELAVQFAARDGLDVSAHATYVDTELAADASPLRQRPEWRGGAQVRWRPMPSVQLASSWTYVGETFDSSIPVGEVMLDAYHRLDVSVAWTVSRGFTLRLALDNVLDESYEEAIGFVAPGMRPRLAFEYRLGGG